MMHRTQLFQGPRTPFLARLGALAIGLFVGLGAGRADAAEKVFGKGVKLEKSTPISEIHAHAGDYDGKPVRIEGLVTDVCSKRGCWMVIAGDREFQTIRIKVADGEIVFPMSAKGKRAIVEGVLTRREVSQKEAIEHARHLAEEAGRPFDPSTIKGPVQELDIKATGALIAG